MNRPVKIEPGSAAKSAEERSAESGAIPREQVKRSVGIRVTGAVGQKFEKFSAPTGAGEALPETGPAQAQAAPPASAEAGAVPQEQFEPSVGIRVTGAVGRKFEKFSAPARAGEALPQTEGEQAPVSEAQPAAKAEGLLSGIGGFVLGPFRRWFR